MVFESMKAAASNSKRAANIQLATVQYEEDKEIIPEYFTVLPNLSRSILDIKSFDKPRKFPLINDILQSAYKHTHSEYIIFTNVDIVVMPFFYDTVFDIIEKGHDAFAINRRRISKQFMHSKNLNEVYAEVGKSHPGFDCFVFRRDLISHFILKNICVGIPFLEASLLYNLVAFSNHFKLFYDKHLTVHIGMDIMPKRDLQFYWHNRHEFFKEILPLIKPRLKAENLPYSELPFHKRMLNYALNPAVFTLLNSELEAKGFWDKVRLLKDEIRFSWLEKN